MLTYFTILILILAFLFWKTVIVVPMREAFVVERLGKFRVILRPGLHFLIPFFDKIAYRHDTREEVLDIPGQSCISQDNIQIEIDGLVYLKVMDPHKASYGIENYKRASVNLAQTTMRSEVGKLKLSQTFSERETLNETIVKEIDRASHHWGIKVMRYEVKNITPSDNVVSTLEKQMEAEREKRSEITLALAEKESRINLSEGERQEAINISEGEKQKKINEAKGKAQEITILAEASARGIDMVGEAIKGPGGRVAVKMRLLDNFINELGNIMDHSDVSVLPNEMANIKGIFEGTKEMSQTLNKN
jgi:regulator of protease activity HflC (stomatin/prohibitin superfamily)